MTLIGKTFTKQSTGESVVLRHTPELAQDVAAVWKANECAHEKRAVYRYRIKGGSFQFREVCECCWRPLGNALRRDSNSAVVPDLDDAVVAKARHEREAAHQAALLGVGRQHATKQLEQRTAYAEYLRSPEWREKRRRVFARARGICEGCCDAAAS